MKKILISVGLGLVAATSQAQAWNAGQAAQPVGHDAVTHQYSPKGNAGRWHGGSRQQVAGRHVRGRASTGYHAPRGAGQSRAQRQAYFVAQQQRKAQMLAHKRRAVQMAAQQRQIAAQKQRQVLAQHKAASQRHSGGYRGRNVAHQQSAYYAQRACGGHVRSNAGRGGYRVQHVGQSRAQRQAYFVAQQQRKTQMLNQKHRVIKQAALQRQVAQQKQRQLLAQHKAAAQRQVAAQQRQRIVQKQRQLAAQRQAAAMQHQRSVQQQHRLAAQRQAAARQQLRPIHQRAASHGCGVGVGTPKCGKWSVVMSYKPQHTAAVHHQAVRQQHHVAVMQPQAAYLPPVAQQQVVIGSQQMVSSVGADCNSGTSQQVACTGGWQRAAGVSPNSRKVMHKSGSYHYG